MIIGYWNLSVVLTYIGLFFSTLGISLLMNSNFNIDFIYVLMVLSGFCDLFDGFVARRIKRNNDEKKFGCEIDSLCDIVSFVIFPSILALRLNSYSFISFAVVFIFVLFGVVRLSYFKVINSNTGSEYYIGMPVTFSSIYFPYIYIFKKKCKLTNGFLMQFDEKIIILFAMIILAILFIVRIRITKPKIKGIIIFSLIGIIALILLCL